MGPLAANLAALERIRPDLAELARAEPGPDFERIDGSDGPNLRERATGAAWYPEGLPAAAAQWSERRDFGRARLATLFGLGLGHELVAAHAARPRRQLIVIEPNLDVFRHALRSTDMAAALSAPNLDLLVGEDLVALRTKLMTGFQHARYLFFARSMSLVFPAGNFESSRDYFRSAMSIYRQAAVIGLNLSGNDPADTLLGLENLQQNLDLVARRPSIRALTDQLRGRPALVASAGPSLVHSLPLLRELAGQIPIFCPDTSVRILLEAGVRPHVATSRERVEVTIEHFRGVDSDGVALACCPVLKPEIFRHHQGPVGFIYRSIDHHRWLAPEGDPLDLDGSAGNFAYRIAALAGCDPIILVGQDLCFSENNETHAPGTATGTRQPAYHPKAEHVVPGTHGGSVTSSGKWLSFLRRFEIDIAEHPQRVINATARGARIAGTEEMSLERALAGVPKGTDPRPEIHAALAERPEAEAEVRRAHLRARLAAARDAIPKLREMAGIGRSFAEKCLTERIRPAASAPDLDLLVAEKPFSTLDGVRQELLRSHNEVFDTYLLPIVQPVFLAIEMDRYARELEAESAEELGRVFVTQYLGWFRDMDGLFARAEALLELGEAALGVEPARTAAV